MINLCEKFECPFWGGPVKQCERYSVSQLCIGAAIADVHANQYALHIEEGKMNGQREELFNAAIAFAIKTNGPLSEEQWLKKIEEVFTTPSMQCRIPAVKGLFKAYVGQKMPMDEAFFKACEIGIGEKPE